MSFKFDLMDDPMGQQFQKHMKHASPKGWIRVQPSGCVMPAGLDNLAQTIKDFQVREDDVWIVTYPKCGTTWSQEMIWLLMNDLDFDTAKKVPLGVRSPWVEWSWINPSLECSPEARAKEIEDFAQLPSPRCIKTHLPLAMLPDQLWKKRPKIIYVARNHRDCVFSYFHHQKLWFDYTGELEDFVEEFLGEAVGFSPFWEHILPFWKMRHEPYILFNTFEEMKKDLYSVAKRTAEFLGKDFTSEQLKALVDHLSFEKMRDNPAVNYDGAVSSFRKSIGVSEASSDQKFFRAGQVGDGRKKIPAYLVEKLDSLAAEHIKSTGYPMT